jgi:hypothetical protein
MLSVAHSTQNLAGTASTLFVPLSFDTACAIVDADRVPPFGEMVKHGGLTPLGVGRFNDLKAARDLPLPWAGRVGEFALLDLTPCTRASFASVTGQPGAMRVQRRDVVCLCISHDALRSLNQPLVYVDRLCSRPDARFSGDRDCLRDAAWERIKRRDFRADNTDPGAVHHYDAAVLAYGSVPMSVVEAIVVKDDAATKRFRTLNPDLNVDLLVRPDLLW